MIKGGVALLLRLDPSRTSNDIDIAYRSEEGALGAALEALENAFQIDLGDFFTFRLAGRLPRRKRTASGPCRFALTH